MNVDPFDPPVGFLAPACGVQCDADDTIEIGPQWWLLDDGEPKGPILTVKREPLRCDATPGHEGDHGCDVPGGRMTWRRK